ncbi:retrovirus-related pol polyprotein from transposon TNT 1-94 [Tanacetum coccineum]
MPPPATIQPSPENFSGEYSGQDQKRSSSSDLTDPHYHAPPRDLPTTTSPLPSLHHHPLTTAAASSPSSPPTSQSSPWSPSSHRHHHRDNHRCHTTMPSPPLPRQHHHKGVCFGGSPTNKSGFGFHRERKPLLLLVTPKIDPSFTLVITKPHRKPDLTFFRVFGALCYPTNVSKDLGKLQPTADIAIFVGYAPSRGYRIYNKRTRKIMEIIHVQFDELSKPMAPVQLSTGPVPMFFTPGQISSGIVPNPVPAAPYVPPTNKELEILFQPMFDEYLEPPRVERPVSPATAVPVPVNSAGTPSSTTIDQDAPTASRSPSSSELQSPCSHQGVASGSTIIEDNPFAHVDNNPFINVFASEPSSEASSLGDVSSAESTHVTQLYHHLGK